MRGMYVLVFVVGWAGSAYGEGDEAPTPTERTVRPAPGEQTVVDSLGGTVVVQPVAPPPNVTINNPPLPAPVVPPANITYEGTTVSPRVGIGLPITRGGVGLDIPTVALDVRMTRRWVFSLEGSVGVSSSGSFGTGANLSFTVRLWLSKNDKHEFRLGPVAYLIYDLSRSFRYNAFDIGFGILPVFVLAKHWQVEMAIGWAVHTTATKVLGGQPDVDPRGFVLLPAVSYRFLEL